MKSSCRHGQSRLQSLLVWKFDSFGPSSGEFRRYARRGADSHAANPKCRSEAQCVAHNPSERGAMSIDIGLTIQLAVLLGQAAQWMTDTIERKRYVGGWHWARYPAVGCVQVVATCYSGQCPNPDPCDPWMCGRTGGHQPRAGCPLPGVRYLAPAARWAVRQARRVSSDANWGCRGRTRNRPHGRHRHC